MNISMIRKLFLSAILALQFGVALTASAQTISTVALTKTVFCQRDTLLLRYTATGTFKPDNFFAVQVSDQTGSFATFRYVGRDTLHLGYIRIPLVDTGYGWQYRIISSDPYIISDTTKPLMVYQYPQTTAEAWRIVRHMKSTWTSSYLGLVGDSIGFQSTYRDTTYQRHWTFGQDGSIQQTTINAPHLIYTSPGIKTAQLIESNLGGCTSQDSITIGLTSCTPTIPKDAFVVTGYDNSPHKTAVWVKAGGTYSPANPTIVFVEPGGSLTGGPLYVNTFYMKAGASLSITTITGFDGGSHGLGILQKGVDIDVSGQENLDTIQCNDLEFDYSQVNSRIVAERPASTIVTHVTNNILEVTGLPQYSTLSAFDLLGRQMLPSVRSHSTSETLRVASLPTGAYYLRVTHEGIIQTSKFVIQR